MLNSDDIRCENEVEIAIGKIEIRKFCTYLFTKQLSKEYSKSKPEKKL